MAGLRYVLIALLAISGCDTATSHTRDAGTHAADGGDAGWRFDYDLCDGSDEIRLAVLTRRGEPDFEEPYGVPNLFVDGHCDFSMALFDQTPGSILQGHLTDYLQQIIDLRFRLAELPKGAFPDPKSCTDPGTVVLATQEFYGECSCGCDDSAPPELERTVREFADVLDGLAKTAGAVRDRIEPSFAAKISRFLSTAHQR